MADQSRVLVSEGVFSVKYPWARLPLSLNQRLHHHAKAKLNRMIRDAARTEFEGVEPVTFCTVEMFWFVNTKHRRDVENPVATLKPWCDGLVDAGLVPDDTPEFMRKLMPEIVYDRGVEPHVEFRVTV